MQNITFDGAQQTIDSAEKKQAAQKPKFDEKNYLNTRLKKGEKSKEIKIRLLPFDKDSSTPFKIIDMHTVKVPKEISESGWKSYVCLKKTEDIDHNIYGDRCPFCEKKDAAFKEAEAETDEILKKKWYDIGKANFSQKVCIVRCIERGHEEDGPKFWKFTLRSDGKDPYHAMINIMENRRSEAIDEGIDPICVFDIYKGKDFKLNIEAVYTKSGEWTNKVSISVYDYGSNKPISQNEDQMKAWIEDEKKWSDVFAIKPYEYLSLISENKTPFFDREKGKWVENTRNKDKQDDNQEMDKVIENAKNEAISQEKVVNNNNIQEENDLPF